MRLVEEREAAVESQAWLEHLGELKGQVERGEGERLAFDEAQREMLVRLDETTDA